MKTRHNRTRNNKKIPAVKCALLKIFRLKLRGGKKERGYAGIC